MGIVSFRGTSRACSGCVWGGIVAIREGEKRVKNKFERRKKVKNDKAVKKRGRGRVVSPLVLLGWLMVVVGYGWPRWEKRIWSWGREAFLCGAIACGA